MNPTISIALATYNGATWLTEQLDSFLHQTRQPNELVVSDDGSTDQTLSILQKFAEKAPFNVQIHVNPENIGATKNFEKAISLCTGDYIFLADQDDVWLPDKICKTVDLLIGIPKAGVAFCNARMCDETLATLGHTLWEALGFSGRKQKKVQSGDALEVFLQYSMIAGMTMAFRSTLRELLLPFPDLLSCHDTWILLLASAVSDIAYTPENLALHRVHEKNFSNITKKNLYQQYLKAKSQIKNNRLTYFLKFHKAVSKRLNEQEVFPLIKPEIRNLVQQKIDHIQCRMDMPESLIKRILPVAREINNKNYQRFSYGFKSALQDLFLRS